MMHEKDEKCESLRLLALSFLQDPVHMKIFYSNPCSFLKEIYDEELGVQGNLNEEDLLNIATKLKHFLTTRNPREINHTVNCKKIHKIIEENHHESIYQRR